MSSRLDKIEFLMGRNEHTSAGSLFMFHYAACTGPPTLPPPRCLSRVALPVPAFAGQPWSWSLLGTSCPPLRAPGTPWQHSGTRAISNSPVCHPPTPPMSRYPHLRCPKLPLRLFALCGSRRVPQATVVGELRLSAAAVLGRAGRRVRDPDGGSTGGTGQRGCSARGWGLPVCFFSLRYFFGFSGGKLRLFLLP